MSRYVDIEPIIASHTSTNCTVSDIPFAEVLYAPSINIVHCKDCKYGQDDLFHMFCAYHHHKTYADDFCNYGERESE